MTTNNRVLVRMTRRDAIQKLLKYLAMSNQQGKTISMFAQLAKIPEPWLRDNMRGIRDMLLRVGVTTHISGKPMRIHLSSDNLFGIPCGAKEVEEWCQDVWEALTIDGFKS